MSRPGPWTTASPAQRSLLPNHAASHPAPHDTRSHARARRLAHGRPEPGLPAPSAQGGQSWSGRRRRSRCCPQRRPGEAAPAPASRRGSLKAEYEVAEEGARRDPPSQAWGWREERATAGEATRTDGWARTHDWGAEGPGRGPAEKQEGAPADRRGGCGPRRPENPRTCSAQLGSSVA